jgi:hypothetical protein
MPAEKDDAAVFLVGEVQEAHIGVFKKYAELVNALNRQVKVVRLDAVLGAGSATTVRGGGFEDRLHMRGFLAHGIAVNGDLFEELL